MVKLQNHITSSCNAVYMSFYCHTAVIIKAKMNKVEVRIESFALKCSFMEVITLQKPYLCGAHFQLSRNYLLSCYLMSCIAISKILIFPVLSSFTWQLSMLS